MFSNKSKQKVSFSSLIGTVKEIKEKKTESHKTNAIIVAGKFKRYVDVDLLVKFTFFSLSR